MKDDKGHTDGTDGTDYLKPHTDYTDGTDF